MDDTELELTEFEKILIQRSSDTAITRRRILQVIVAASLFAVLLVATVILSKSALPSLVVGLLYIAITTLEKVAYGKAVLAYKSVIHKLAKRVDAAETMGDGKSN